MPSKNCCKKIQYLPREACATIDGQLVTVSYIENPVNSSISNFRRLDTMELIEEPQWSDCCPTTEVQRYSQCFIGFDYQDLDAWEAGDDSIEWTIDVDGNISNSIDFVTLQDDGNKSSWYENLVNAVNDTSWSMSVQSDVLSSSGSDKVTWVFTGEVGSTLTITRNSGTLNDVLTMTVNSDGSISTTFENGGDICSACTECVTNINNENNNQARLVCSECPLGTISVTKNNYSTGGFSDFLIQGTSLKLVNTNSNWNYLGNDLTVADLNIDWGDGSPIEVRPNAITPTSWNTMEFSDGVQHVFPSVGQYYITLWFISDSGLKWEGQYFLNLIGTGSTASDAQIAGTFPSQIQLTLNDCEGNTTPGIIKNQNDSTSVDPQGVKFINNTMIPNSAPALNLDGLFTEGNVELGYEREFLLNGNVNVTLRANTDVLVVCDE